jgi:DNA invertase Pin-like site-specific DNA recombinase
MIYGYARVSTDGQSVDAQVKQLRDAGAEKVFREPASGARSDRAQLRRALDQLGKGDVLMVTRLDRLARSTRDLLNTVRPLPRRKPGSGPLATHGPTPQLRTGGLCWPF